MIPSRELNVLQACFGAIIALSATTAYTEEFQAWPRDDANSLKAHEQLVAKARSGRIDVYFLGDSITRRWGCSDPAYKNLLDNWRRHFHGWNAANFGWGGDTTHNVLWRIENGELDGVRPAVIALQIGTNDIGARSYGEVESSEKIEEIVCGIDAILATCHEKTPQSAVLLTGVFPRSDNAGVADLIVELNKRIAPLGAARGVTYVDINRSLTDPQGSLLKGMTVDGLHLSEAGYDIWAAALKPHLHELLGPPKSVDLAPAPTGDPSINN
jgi:lysophospholipase L1-like esterase